MSHAASFLGKRGEKRGAKILSVILKKCIFISPPSVKRVITARDVFFVTPRDLNGSNEVVVISYSSPERFLYDKYNGCGRCNPR